ncbi:conserved hypothetical protein [Ricinus communis]|uniref:TF-B3 domain-containing protein n=1 Tax=Ricinus communis TaxID=3988 RepID=B9T232_RICCO|nr:conserved hypothetical protein [Ricinus communis]
MASCSKQDNGRLMFKTNRPHFFKGITEKFANRYGNGKHSIHIPQSFATKYLRSHGNATLNVLDGRTWSVEYKIRRTHGTTRTRLFHGWKKFAQDNHLEIGDVCIFELINRTKTAFKHVPVKSMVKCTKRSRENVMLIVGNRQWPVKMISYTSDGRSKFSAGWLGFARGILYKLDIFAFSS